MKIIETENLQKCDLINFSDLFEEIKACRWKEDLVNTFARYGIKDDTKKTGPTDNIDKSGKSKDLYASFRTPDNKRTATHILFEVNKIRVNTNDSIAFSPYFFNYEIYDNTNDGLYRNKYFNIAYDVDEFKYVMAYFLKYDLNWLDREYKEIEAVNKVNFQESVISEQNKIVQEHLNNIASIIEKEIEQVPVYGEDKKTLTKIRINQSVFRELLLKRYSSCCLCNVNDKNFLVASHIKPWAKSNSEEKLDVNNGLLLCPNHDKLFDGGWISFNDDGHILISDELKSNDKIFMNVMDDIRWFADWNRKGTVLQWDIKRVIISKNTAVVERYFQCDYEGNVDGFDGVTIVEFNAKMKICELKEFQSKAEHYYPYGNE